jgi:hypothetical protein
MGTSITPAVLTVTQIESITLNGAQQGGTNSFSIDDIKDVYKRILTIDADTDATVLVVKINTATSDGAFDKERIKYIRITNLDSSAAVTISLQLDSDEDSSAADIQSTHLLAAKQSFVMGTPDEAVHVKDDTAAISTGLTDLESILVNPGAVAGTVEIFVASI